MPKLVLLFLLLAVTPVKAKVVAYLEPYVGGHYRLSLVNKGPNAVRVRGIGHAGKEAFGENRQPTNLNDYCGKVVVTMHSANNTLKKSVVLPFSGKIPVGESVEILITLHSEIARPDKLSFKLESPKIQPVVNALAEIVEKPITLEEVECVGFEIKPGDGS